jgi:hypothetical protein
MEHYRMVRKEPVGAEAGEAPGVVKISAHGKIRRYAEVCEQLLKVP